jgi:hypothetical protein
VGVQSRNPRQQAIYSLGWRGQAAMERGDRADVLVERGAGEEGAVTVKNPSTIHFGIKPAIFSINGDRGLILLTYSCCPMIISSGHPAGNQPLALA